jgi:hypothetical protein
LNSQADDCNVTINASISDRGDAANGAAINTGAASRADSASGANRATEFERMEHPENEVLDVGRRNPEKFNVQSRKCPINSL